jgi:rhamnogalacturonyl hydrolase YesR
MARSDSVRAFCRLLTVALLLCASRGWSEALRIPLALTEPAGVARTDAPVTVGVPLPAGRGRADDFWVAAPDGKPVLTQTRVLERWPDASPRWVLVDFLASAGARESVTYMLHDGRAPAQPRGPVAHATDGPKGKLLSTGVVSALVPKDASALLEDVRIGDAPAGVGVARPAFVLDGVTSGDDVRDPHLGIETEGPVRTEVLLTGRDASDLVWEARIAAFAGVPSLRVQLTLTSLSTRPYTHVRSFLVAVNGADFTEGALGVGGTTRRFPLDEPHEIFQPDFQSLRVDGAGSEGQGDGWARATREGAVVTLVRRYFAEEWPQRLKVARTGIAADLLAGVDEPVDLGGGAAKTFEFWVAVEPPAHAADPAALTTALQRPLVARPDPAWVVKTRALANALAPTVPGASAVLARVESGIGRYVSRNRAERWDDGAPVPCEQRTSEHERRGAYGALNWGDWNFPGYRDRSEGCDAWGNLEYDLTQVLGLAWAAGGARADWDTFVAAARHYRDVDVVHIAPGGVEELRGFNHPHKVKHFAVESPNSFDLGHTWLEGLVTHYRLTGEVRSLEAVRSIADVLVRRRYKAGNPRQYGWPMIALSAAYDATGDARYRDAAASYADDAATTHDATPATGDWKMGILADGVATVHAITGTSRLRDWLVHYADALAAEPKRFPDARYALPLGYLATLTNTTRYRTTGAAVVDRLEIGDWGKTLAISGRAAFRILGGGAQAAAPTPAPAAPRRPSASEPTPRSPSPRAPARRTAH